jgi:hypothetical protein
LSDEFDIRIHSNYVSDPHRVGAYESAIPEVVREGDRVLDLASGTSLLGLLALRAGASHVTSVDLGPIVQLARDIVRQNGEEHRVRIVRGLSTRVDLPREFDVVLSDQVGCFAFDAGILFAYSDARRRFLVPGARILPSHVSARVVPLCSDRLYRKVKRWESPVAGLDMSPGRVHAANTRHLADFDPDEVIGEDGTVWTWEMQTADTTPVRSAIEMEIQREGAFHGFGGWATAVLAGDVTLTCDPRDERRIQRSNVFFPLEEPVDVKEGDRVEALFRIVPRQHLVAWDVTVRRGTDVLRRCSQSTFRGKLLDPQVMQRHRPDWAPSMSRRGEAIHACLTMMQDGATVADLRGFLAEHYRDIAHDDDDLTLLLDQVVDTGTWP